MYARIFLESFYLSETKIWSMRNEKEKEKEKLGSKS
jgi:hypothetical protein